MRLLLILLILPIALFGQTIDYEKNDSIHIETYTFSTYVLKIKDYSASDPAKVFVIPAESFDSLKRQIPKLYSSRKQEYNEYYVLAVPDLFQTEIVKQAVMQYLNQIDNSRVLRNRSTFLRSYRWDNTNKKMEYNTTKKDLQLVDNLHYLYSTKDLCKYMMCRYE